MNLQQYGWFYVLLCLVVVVGALSRPCLAYTEEEFFSNVKFSCQDGFDQRAEIIGSSWGKVSEEGALASAKNGIFCAIREQSYIDYHFNQSISHRLNLKINWRKAHCLNGREIAFEGNRPTKKLNDPWTVEDFYVSILCTSTSTIEFEFSGLQPLTKVDTMLDYDVNKRRFQLTVLIPYVPEKTGNYTFKATVKGNQVQEWFYIYFKRSSPPYLLPTKRTDWSAPFSFDREIDHHVHRGDHLIIPCRTTNPDLQSVVQLCVGAHYALYREEIMCFSPNTTRFAPAEGLSIHKSVLTDLMAGFKQRILEFHHDEVQYEFYCRETLDLVKGKFDQPAIYYPHLYDPSEGWTWAKNELVTTEKFPLACPSLGNATWDYISNIYASTPMESDLILSCLDKSEECQWNSAWDPTGRRVFGNKRNIRFVDCKEDPVGYPCTLMEVFKSGVAACIKEDGKIILREKYFTGLDGHQYFLKDWKASKVPISATANLEVLSDPKEYIAGETYEFQCSAVPFIFTPGYTWNIRLSNGTILKYVGANVPRTIWVGIDKATGVRKEREHLTLPQGTVGVSCNFFSYNDTQEYKVEKAIVAKDKSIPRFLSTETLVKFSYEERSPIIRCSVYGVPLPQVWWSSSGGNIIDHSVVKVVEMDVIHLELRVRPMDKSEYSCNAINAQGLGSQKFTVHFEIPPLISSEALMQCGMFFGLFLLSAAFLHRRYIGKYHLLTKKDVERFMYGDQDKNKQEPYMNYRMLPYSPSFEINSRSYEVDYKKILGSGQYGVVYQGKLRGEKVAVKTVKNGIDRENLLAFLDEIKIMMHLGDHENVIKFLGADTTGVVYGQVTLFVELCPLGSLLDVLRGRKRQQPGLDDDKAMILANNRAEEYCYPYENVINLDERRLVLWAHQICSGMNFLSKKGVIHGDLAARNILLTDLDHIKITDFGLSRQLQNYAIYKKSKQQPLPWRWLSPEALNNMEFSVKSDVWAFGVTIWEIFSLGGVPYCGLGWSISFVNMLTNGMRLQKPHMATQWIFELMRDCWAQKPEDRPKFLSLERRLFFYYIDLAKEGNVNSRPYSQNEWTPSASLLTRRREEEGWSSLTSITCLGRNRDIIVDNLLMD